MNKKAFGLLETVIAMMIVTMTVLAVYDSIAQSRRILEGVSERSGGVSFASIFTNEPSLITDKENIDLKAHIASRYGISDMALIPASFEVNATVQDTREEERIMVGRDAVGKVRKYISNIDGRRTEWYKIIPEE
jgi:Tfp pilus assembly protein PilV